MLELVATSRFRVVVIVPVFHRPASVGPMVSAAREAGLRCILVDDGSNAAGAAAMEAMVSAHGRGLVTMRVPAAQSIGGAVMAGLRHAGELGYSHAVQVDVGAPGGHDPMAIGRFVALARRYPEALICGLPGDERSRPWLGLFVQWLARLWTWATALSYSMSDWKCGFRIYPLALIVPMLDEIPLGTRMDFDTEVLVRAHWRGASIIGRSGNRLRP